MKNDQAIVYYNVHFDEETAIPKILECIKVDRDLRILLQYSGNPIPLPPWLVHSRNGKLDSLTQLENLPAYIRDIVNAGEYSIFEELEKRQHYKPKGRPPFSSALIRYALLLRHTSAQAYRLLLEKFPLPSFSTLAKIQKGGVDALKAAKFLREQNKLSNDVVLMVDEMYLEKSCEYDGGNYIGADSDGKLYKGLVAFMIIGLKRNVPYVIRASPEVTLNGVAGSQTR